jgi:hypothetical protein
MKLNMDSPSGRTLLLLDKFGREYMNDALPPSCRCSTEDLASVSHISGAEALPGNDFALAIVEWSGLPVRTNRRSFDYAADKSVSSFAQDDTFWVGLGGQATAIATAIVKDECKCMENGKYNGSGRSMGLCVL